MFYKRGCFFRGIISFLFPRDKVVYGSIDDHNCESTFILANSWAKGKAMGVKRVFFETP